MYNFKSVVLAIIICKIIESVSFGMELVATIPASPIVPTTKGCMYVFKKVFIMELARKGYNGIESCNERKRRFL